MSRTSPFPNNRLPNGNSSTSSSANASNATRPLQPNRPTTPSSNASRGSPSLASPARPQRSELRSRGDRDSTGTAYSDAPSYSKPSRPNVTSSTSSSRPPRMRTGTVDFVESPVSPPTMNTVMSAFQSAGRARTMSLDPEEQEYRREREAQMEDELRRAQRIRDMAPGERRLQGKARIGGIDAVLDQIQDGWEFITRPEFNSVDLALELLDGTGMGKDMESFRKTKNMLSRALKGSVDKHYQSFAAALPHHSSLLNSLGDVQDQLSNSRSALSDAKESLGTRRTDLMQLWTRGQTLEEMMRLLDEIERLKSVPDLLESLMSEKRLLQASVLLVRSLKIINKPDMLEIGAVSDLRAYLVGQESALRDILIDELHAHLYLKSFWCESRWSAYVPTQGAFPKVLFEDETDLKAPVAPQSSPSSPTFVRQSRLNRFIHDLAIRPNDPPHDLNDPNFRGSVSGISSSSNTAAARANESIVNPESDSFAYLESVLESLAVLGRLGNALESAVQRLPVEVYALVETTLDEVSERAEYGKRAAVSTLGSARSESVYVISSIDSPAAFGAAFAPDGEYIRGAFMRLSALESSAKEAEHETLRDFFWTLYSKMDAVAQGLRIVFEVANRIGSRRDFKDSSGNKPESLFPLEEVWMAVQAEIRTVIYDYLTNEEQGTVSGRNPISAINEILRDGKFSRDKSKSVFRFADTDPKLTGKALKQHEEELTRALKDTMPGLVQNPAENAVQATLSSVGTDDRILGAGQHHRLLIKPDAFHVSVLFEPTLAFLDRISEVLPSELNSGRASTGAVIDDFVLMVYLPQLEEKVTYLFHRAVTGPDAFLPDPLYKRLSPQPLVKSSTELMALINSLRVMLQTTPFHRENYSRLIIGVIIQYYQQCSDRFQDLVTIPTYDGTEPAMALSAQWAQRSELTPCLSELLITPDPDLPIQQQLCRQETNVELGFIGQDAVKKNAFVPSVRNLAALASLYHTITWFAGELSAIKPLQEDTPPTPFTAQPLSAIPTTAIPYAQLRPLTMAEQFTLPLSKEMSLRYQALIKTFEQFAELILVTLRIDVRCRTLYYLDSAMRHGHYSIDREAGEPDPHILDLNTELGECDDHFAVSVSIPARQFIFVGLGHLMEHLLISSARHLKIPTTFGIKKILRNILALQQSIKTITTDRHNSEFEHAKRYYGLFFMTPQEMLDGIRQKQVFTFDEYQTMLGLQCGVDQTKGGDPRVSKGIDRNYSMYVIDLHGLEIENA